VRLTTPELIDYISIVAHETDPHARHLLDHWAQPGDIHPGQERALEATLAMLWRTPATEPAPQEEPPQRRATRRVATATAYLLTALASTTIAAAHALTTSSRIAKETVIGAVTFATTIATGIIRARQTRQETTP
jgi:hypothetical protein